MSYLFSWKLEQRSELESQISGALFDQEKQDALIAQASAVDSTFTTWACVLGIIMLLLLLPALAAMTRRLHDTGRSGWMIWLLIIPVVNFVMAIVIFIWSIMDSKPEDNKYGPSPKYVDAA